MTLQPKEECKEDHRSVIPWLTPWPFPWHWHFIMGHLILSQGLGLCLALGFGLGLCRAQNTTKPRDPMTLQQEKECQREHRSATTWLSPQLLVPHYTDPMGLLKFCLGSGLGLGLCCLQKTTKPRDTMTLQPRKGMPSRAWECDIMALCKIFSLAQPLPHATFNTLPRVKVRPYVPMVQKTTKPRDQMTLQQEKECQG